VDAAERYRHRLISGRPPQTRVATWDPCPVSGSPGWKPHTPSTDFGFYGKALLRGQRRRQLSDGLRSENSRRNLLAELAAGPGRGAGPISCCRAIHARIDPRPKREAIRGAAGDQSVQIFLAKLAQEGVSPVSSPVNSSEGIHEALSQRLTRQRHLDVVSILLVSGGGGGTA